MHKCTDTHTYTHKARKLDPNEKWIITEGGPEVVLGFLIFINKSEYDVFMLSIYPYTFKYRPAT